jgi:hypothetical protein
LELHRGLDNQVFIDLRTALTALGWAVRDIEVTLLVGPIQTVKAIPIEVKETGRDFRVAKLGGT